MSLSPKPLSVGGIKELEQERYCRRCPAFALDGDTELAKILAEGKGQIFSLQAIGGYDILTDALQLQSAQVYAEPLINRQGDSIGILCLVYGDGDSINTEKQQGQTGIY